MHSKVVDCILRDAPGMLAGGKAAALEERIVSLPDELVRRTPLLVYYLGLSRLLGGGGGGGGRCKCGASGQTAPPPKPNLMLHLPEDGTVPAALHVQCFGRFALEGLARSGKKQQKKPLEMLKALVGYCGSASEALLADALWPDSDGDAAKASFTSTLHRLRKLLGHKETVVLEGGWVHLNPLYLATDVASFHRMVCMLDEALSRELAEKAEALAGKIMDLYKGPFLSDESYHWAGGPRQRLHFKLLSRMSGASKLLECAGEFGKASALCLRVLDIDECAEEFYLRLMACYRTLGQCVEARDVYGRLCLSLQGVGRNPSEEARSLHSTL